jgi:hypothetical protein
VSLLLYFLVQPSSGREGQSVANWRLGDYGKYVGFSTGFLLFSAVFLILYVTLFPFDFVPPKGMTLSGFFEGFDTRFHPRDFPGNILLFFPFGFALAMILCAWGLRAKTAFAVTLAAGLLFSLSVEILQMFLLRFSSFVDVFANSTGALLGGLIFIRWGGHLIRKTGRFWVFLTQQVSITNLVSLLLLYAVLILVVCVALRKSSELNSWDPSFSLLLGNEWTGDRPWQGKVSDVFLSDRALSVEEITTIFEKGDISDLDRKLFFAYYPLTGGDNFRDQYRNLPDLRWHSSVLDRQGQDGVHISPSNWLESQAPVSMLTNSIRSSSQFTVGITFASCVQSQTGPARIITISADPYLRNLTVGQEGNDLILRLRTPLTGENGRQPEFIIPNLLTSGDFHHLTITYDGNTLKMYVDGRPEPYFFEFSPEVALFWLFTPSKIEQIRLNAFHPLIFKLMFYSLAFTPLSFLSVLILQKVKVKVSR